MDINFNVLAKTEKNIDEEIKVLSTKDIVNLKQVQAIRNAIKEHLLFIGLDRGNNIRDISILGIDSSCKVSIDSKDIIRTALFSCSDRVILVHNHPSNNTEPSPADVHISNVVNQILEVFNIQLLDHIIVTEKEYISMDQIKKITRDYNDNSIDKMSKGLLLEENQKLKKKVEELKEKLEEKDYNSDFEFEI